MAKPRVGILPYKMVEKASKDLPWDAAFALVYLWTCPHRRIGGLFRLPLGYMASDLDISASEAKDKMTLLEGKGYIAYESGVVYLRGYMQAQNKFQGKVSLDTAKGMASDIAEIEPPKRLLSLWESEARSIPALLESLINQGYVPLSESESGSESESEGVRAERIPSMCPAPAEYVEGAHQVRSEHVPTACRVRSEYIPSTYSVGTQHIPGYVPSGIGSGTGSGSESESESKNINIKDLRISNEIREDFSSSSGHDHDSERDILSEATEYDSTGSVGFTGLETVSSPKRKIAVDGNDRNRKSSDNAERDANAKDKDLEDCEKDHEPVCASGAGSGCGGASDCDIRAGCGGCEADSARSDADRKTNHAPDLAAETGFCDSACGLGDSGGSSFCASAHAHACDGRRQEDASVPASEDVSGAASGNAPADVLDDDVGGHERRSPNPCPHKEIVAIYHEVLPELRSVRSWNATREKHLRARWREDKRRQSLSWWREYFTRVKASSFLTGKKTDWSADFDWLIRPTNMAKVLEGKYDDSPPHERAQTHERARGTNVETLFRELVSSWPADRVGDVQAAKKTFCSVIDVGIEEGNRRLKNLEAWALIVLEREPKYVPRLDKWLAGLDVSIPPPESRQCEYEWVPVARACAVEDGEFEAVAS